MFTETLATEEEIRWSKDKVAEIEFYDPEEWRRVYLARPYPLKYVEFDDDEQVMIREMAHKFGYPRNDIVRMAVRDAYVHYMVR